MSTTKKTKKTTIRTVKKALAVNKKPTARKTDAQMRVLIAKDVLAQIAARRYRPAPGWWLDDSNMSKLADYVDNRFEEMEDQKQCNISIDANDYVSKVKSCSVCALGSIFMSQARTPGSVVFTAKTASAYEAFEDLSTSPLSKYFSENQLVLIEACFEGNDGMYACDISDGNTKLLSQAYVFTYKSSTARLTAIMRNIVRNKGTFVPSQDVTKEALIQSGDYYLS